MADGRRSENGGKHGHGKLRYPPCRRVAFCRFLIDVIRGYVRRPSIGLCRQTPDVWNQLSRLCDPDRCNCLVW